MWCSSRQGELPETLAGRVMNSVNRPQGLIALFAVLACGYAPAHAADLPARTAPALVAAPPTFTWQGLHMGFNYGYAWEGSRGVGIAGSPLYDTTILQDWSAASARGATGGVRTGLEGFFGGGQIGYDWQTGPVVLGVEADIQGGGIAGRGGYNSIVPEGGAGAAALTMADVRRHLRTFGTVRGRLGYAITPTILGYVTGGLAYGNASVGTTMIQSLDPSALTSDTARASGSRQLTGWTLGAGAEMAIAPNLSAKLEYLYYDLGSMRTSGSLTHTDPLTGRGLGTAFTTSTRFNGSSVRMGLNYRFGDPSAEGSQASAFAPAMPAASDRVRFGDWEMSFIPYTWATGLNGSSTAKGQATNVDASFVDILTKASSFPLEIAAKTEIRNGPLSFYGEFVGAQIRFAGSSMVLRNPIADATLGLAAKAHTKLNIAILEGGSTFELARWGYAGAPEAFTAIDAVAGVRYWNVGVNLSLDTVSAASLANLGYTQIGYRAIAKSGTMSWVDPLVGLRLRQQIDATNAFYVKGDVGGFGAGSKFSWQAEAAYTHDFRFAGLDWTSMIGYRALYADYEQGSGLHRSGLNAVMHGPVTGLGVKF